MDTMLAHMRTPHHISLQEKPSCSGRKLGIKYACHPSRTASSCLPLSYTRQTLKHRRSVHNLRALSTDTTNTPTTTPGSAYLDKLLADPNIEGDLSSLLRVTEAFWKAQKTGKSPKAPTIVTEYPTQSLGGDADFDVVVAGGTLGLFVALSLQLRGARVCIVERRRIEGRTQEWNSSRSELQVLVRLGLITQDQLESIIVTEFNPVRVGFKGMDDLWVRDCLNVGVDPVGLVAAIKARFREMGGVIKEHTELKKVSVFPDGVRVTVAAGGNAPMDVTDVNRPTAVRTSTTNTPSQRATNFISGRLLLDCMGHYSSIVKQIRGDQQPDGMLVVMGGCFDGMPANLNTTADLLYTFDNVDPASGLQWFWEAFPADQGRARTAYMFAYTDADPSRPSFRDMLTTYFDQLATYQDISLDDIRFRRVLMGGFPCWQNSPLQPAFNRVLQVADASAAHSPLSFGGFGSLLRHLPRLTAGITDALECDRLDRESLAWLQPYQPSLSCSWLYQRSMGLAPGHLEGSGGGVQLPADHVNRLLVCNFAVMRVLGDRFMRPFLQDTLRLVPLASTMFLMMFKDPVAILRVLPQVGPGVFFSWFKHFAALITYTVLYNASTPVRGVLEGSYEGRRMLDAWKWGSSSDYEYHPPTLPLKPAQDAGRLPRDASSGLLAEEGAVAVDGVVVDADKALVGGGVQREVAEVTSNTTRQ